MQLDISYDSFIRTTDKRHEVTIVSAKASSASQSGPTIYALCLTIALIVTGCASGPGRTAVTAGVGQRRYL